MEGSCICEVLPWHVLPPPPTTASACTPATSTATAACATHAHPTHVQQNSGSEAPVALYSRSTCTAHMHALHTCSRTPVLRHRHHCIHALRVLPTCIPYTGAAELHGGLQGPPRLGEGMFTVCSLGCIPLRKTACHALHPGLQANACVMHGATPAPLVHTHRESSATHSIALHTPYITSPTSCRTSPA